MHLYLLRTSNLLCSAAPRKEGHGISFVRCVRVTSARNDYTVSSVTAGAEWDVGMGTFAIAWRNLFSSAK